MNVQQIGHAVLKVRDVKRAEDFYNGVLGLPIAARLQEDGMEMTFFTLGNHHDFAVLGVGSDAPVADQNATGLFHVAFKVGDNLDDLRKVKEEIDAAGVPVVMAADHTVTQSLYVLDPDANTIELYVDSSDAWRTDPQLVATISPLEL